MENKLDSDFNKVKEQVDAKLAEAANLIREASELARSKGEYLANFEYNSPFNTKVLEHAMDDAGWSTSSWYC